MATQKGKLNQGEEETLAKVRARMNEPGNESVFFREIYNLIVGLHTLASDNYELYKEATDG